MDPFPNLAQYIPKIKTALHLFAFATACVTATLLMVSPKVKWDATTLGILALSILATTSLVILNIVSKKERSTTLLLIVFCIALCITIIVLAFLHWDRARKIRVENSYVDEFYNIQNMPITNRYTNILAPSFTSSNEQPGMSQERARDVYVVVGSDTLSQSNASASSSNSTNTQIRDKLVGGPPRENNADGQGNRIVLENMLPTSTIGDGGFSSAGVPVLDAPGVRQQIKDWENVHLKYLEVDQKRSSEENNQELGSAVNSFNAGDKFEGHTIPVQSVKAGYAMEAWDAVSTGCNFIGELMGMLHRAHGNVADKYVTVTADDPAGVSALFRNWSSVTAFNIQGLDVGEGVAKLRFTTVSEDLTLPQEGYVMLRVILNSQGANVWGAEKIVLLSH